MLYRTTMYLNKKIVPVYNQSAYLYILYIYIYLYIFSAIFLCLLLNLANSSQTKHFYIVSYLIFLSFLWIFQGFLSSQHTTLNQMYQRSFFSLYSMGLLEMFFFNLPLFIWHNCFSLIFYPFVSLFKKLFLIYSSQE